MCDDLNENDPHRLICLKLGLQLVERIRGGHAGGGVAVLEEVWPCWRRRGYAGGGVVMLEEVCQWAEPFPVSESSSACLLPGSLT